MSKKKVRKFKHRTGDDKHHIFFQKRYWSRGTLKILRDNRYCLAYIPEHTLHHKIHLNITTVPNPKPMHVSEALYQLNMLRAFGAIKDDDSIEKKLEVLIALFEDVEPETTAALKEQLKLVRAFYNRPS